MSVYDLATDVGLVKGSDDYEAFVACVQNILELGTGYSPAAMQDIVEKCNTSELEIAKRVVRECRREKKNVCISRNTLEVVGNICTAPRKDLS